jgi:hypothetical protein
VENTPSSPASEPSKTDAIALVLTACIISGLLTYLVYSRSIVFGSEAGHWVYPYLSAPPLIPRWTVAAVLLMLGAFVFLGSRLIQSHEGIALPALFLAAILLQSLMRSIYPYSMGELVQGEGANSFYHPAMSYGAAEIISRFESLAESFPLHARSNMPGKILLFELFELITSSPEVMGYLVIVFSTLGALLLYGICKRLFHDRRIAFYALTLYVLLPGKLLFFPILNTVTPVFMLLCFYLFVIYLDNKHFLIPVLLGIALFALVLFEPSPLIAGIVIGGIGLYEIREKKLSTRDLYRLLLYASLAFLAMGLLFFVVFSFSLPHTFLRIWNDARMFNIVRGRGYGIWIIENSKEFFYAAGVPVMMIFIFMTVRILAEGSNPVRWSLENVYVIALLVNFLVLLFLGINRGETTRLWIYLAALFQVPASILIARAEKRGILMFLVACTLALQTMVTFHRMAFVSP